MHPVPIEACRQIDLSHHGLIEASAGTGKTYTIESLVLRYLCEQQDLALEQILLLTFTEKAASELKVRIREKIEVQLRQESGLPAGLYRKLCSTLDGFDNAPIFTIHGFCHRILQDYAFENGSLFTNERISDGPLLDTLLKDQMRRDWPRRYGDQLPALLKISGFADRPEAVGRLIRALAGGLYRPSTGDLLLPHMDGNDPPGLMAALTERIFSLKQMMGPAGRFGQCYARLNFNAAAKRSLLEKIVQPIEAYLQTIPGPQASPDLVRFSDLILAIRKVRSRDKQGIRALVPDKWLKSGENLSDCPCLMEVVQAVESLDRLHDQMAYLLIGAAAHRLKRDGQACKAANGWISYDDMLSSVLQGLRASGGHHLRRQLRQRFRVAMVDEFQDTDPIQWQIFKDLFIDADAESHDCRLFLIGDPKQAIYAFRGADVYAYLEARQTMIRLAGQGRAGLYALATNYRSGKGLIHAFNRLFSAAAWFPCATTDGSQQIAYDPVHAPAGRDRDCAVAGDPHPRSPLTLLDITQAPTVAAARHMLIAMISAEIQQLVRHGRLVGDPPLNARSLTYGDICILVRGKSEAALVETGLNQHQIPYSFYKKPGLFQSDEAGCIAAVLDAILHPADAAKRQLALLTPFFDIPAESIGQGRELPGDHPSRQLLLRWRDMSERRQWGRLFQSLLAESGLIFRRAATAQFERMHANYLQLFEFLQQQTYLNNLDGHGIFALLENRRRQLVPAEELDDIHQIETEAAKVQLMTMHVSKGLEFPVVFIAGGLTQPADELLHVFHRQDDNGARPGSFRKVIDLTRRADPPAAAQERVQEDKRLLYVALTRARGRLYLPYLPWKSQQRWVGPLCRFVADSIQQAFGRPTAGDPPVWLRPAELEAAAKLQALLEHTQPHDPATARGRDIGLPPAVSFLQRKPQMASFSRINATWVHHPDAVSRFESTGQILRDDDEPRDAIAVIADPADHPADRLPAGAHVGSMFHEILEKLEFGKVTTEPAALLADPTAGGLIAFAMQRYGVDLSWRTTVAEVISATLNSPFMLEGRGFTLNRLDGASRLHEVEFCFTLSPAPRIGPAAADLLDHAGPQGYLKGYVDLIFRVGHRYYIADWKSNLVVQGYSPAAITAHMNEAGYHLQYRIYTLALMRYLKATLGEGFDPLRHMGGVYYFYLRGMGRGADSGVFFKAADTLGGQTALEQEITRLVEGRQPGVRNADL